MGKTSVPTGFSLSRHPLADPAQKPWRIRVGLVYLGLAAALLLSTLFFSGTDAATAESSPAVASAITLAAAGDPAAPTASAASDPAVQAAPKPLPDTSILPFSAGQWVQQNKAMVTLIVLAVMAIFFITEIIPLAITSLSGAVALGLLGIIPMKTVFTGLSNSTVVLFAAMFVIGAGMFHTGLAQTMGEAVVRLCGTGERSLMFGTMIAAMILSAVCSNTGTTAALMPVVIGICVAAGMAPSRQLMPLAFAAGLGGTITLVGTPPNLIANQVLAAHNYATFGFFEFAKIGIPLCLGGAVFMVLCARFLLPRRDADMELAKSAGGSETKVRVHDPKKKVIMGCTLLGVVLIMAFVPEKTLPLEIPATIGAILLVLTGCLKEKEAYRGIDWVTIFLFAGMMPMATALDKSGAGKLIAEQVIAIMGGSPSPLMLTAVLFILTCGLTQFMSNTASATLLCPIGLAIAEQIHVSPHAVLMSIAIAASCAFATPVGTPPNTLVLGAGNYRFMDYVRFGLPLVLVSFVICLFVIPFMWPFALPAQ